MTHLSDSSSAREFNDAERNTPPSEVPMPEQQTGDVPASPNHPAPTPDKESPEANPANPPSDRA